MTGGFGTAVVGKTAPSVNLAVVGLPNATDEPGPRNWKDEPRI